MSGFIIREEVSNGKGPLMYNYSILELQPASKHQPYQKNHSLQRNILTRADWVGAR